MKREREKNKRKKEKRTNTFDIVLSRILQPLFVLTVYDDRLKLSDQLLLCDYDF